MVARKRRRWHRPYGVADVIERLDQLAKVVGIIDGKVDNVATEQELEAAVQAATDAFTAQNAAVLAAIADLEAKIGAAANIPQEVIDSLDALKTAAGAEQAAAEAADPGPQP